MKPRNILILCLDTVRKDYFDQYAPRLRARADISFEQCRAASSWSVPSHASMLTGQLPHAHGVHAHQHRFDRIDESDTFLGGLPDHRTIGASANIYAGSAFGFDSFFDEFIDVSREQRYPNGLDVAEFMRDQPDSGPRRYFDVIRASLRHEQPLASVYNAICLQLDVLARHTSLNVPVPFDDGARILKREITTRIHTSEEPFVLFANFMDAHEPHRDAVHYDQDHYSVPRGWSSQGLDNWNVIDSAQNTAPSRSAQPSDENVDRSVSRYRELYGAAIEYLDRIVTALIDDALSLTECETTVIVTADHGENLAYSADENLFGHVASVSEGVLHVPLLVINPPENDPNYKEDFTSHLSIRQLVTGLARGKMPDITGSKVAAEVIGLPPGNEPLLNDDPEYWDRMLRCVYKHQQKYVWDTLGERSEYTITPLRPCWQRHVQNDVTLPSWVTSEFDRSSETYRQELETRRPSDSIGEDVDEAVERRLEDLGYR